MNKAYAEVQDLRAVLKPEAVGWANSHSPNLAELVFGAKTVIEVGSFTGASVIWMAQHNTEANFFCVDTFLGSPEIKDDGRTPRSHGRPMYLERFLFNTYCAGVAERITPVINTSTQSARLLREAGILADLIYIDAGHDYLECYNDLVAYNVLLKRPGVMLVDDFHDNWPGVVAAVYRFCLEAGYTLDAAHDQAILRPNYTVEVRR